MDNNNLREQLRADYPEFFEKYPEAPISEPIKCLNLIMKREFAEAILKGEKTVEYRSYSKHYVDRLFDKKVMDWGDNNVAEEDLDLFMEVCEPLRWVEKIHFHNYNNTWFLDVAPKGVFTVPVTRENVEVLKTEYHSDELEEMCDDLDKMKEQNRPIFFVFPIDKILDTNLK